jgi:hypothetical protein
LRISDCGFQIHEGRFGREQKHGAMFFPRITYFRQIFSPFAFCFLDFRESVPGAVEGSIQFALLGVVAECLEW